MWIPEFLMVYKIRGERAGWVMSRVGNDRGGELDRGGRGRGGGSPVGKRRGGNAGGGTRLIPDSTTQYFAVFCNGYSVGSIIRNA